MPLTEQQIFDAAEQVRESGKVPSALNIREITQTGSLGTIQKFLRKWRHQETVSSASVNPPPEPVLNAVRQFSEQLWQLALQNSEKAASLKVRQANEHEQEAQRDTDEAMENVEKLQQELELERAKQSEAELQQQKIQMKLEEHQSEREAWLVEREQLIAQQQQTQNKLEQSEQSLGTYVLKLNESLSNLKNLEARQSALQQNLDSAQAVRQNQQSKIESLQHQEQQLAKKYSEESADWANQESELRETLQQSELELNRKKEQLVIEQQERSQDAMTIHKLKLGNESEKQLNLRLEKLLEKLHPQPTA
jgi:hypothetical protein